MLGINEMRLSAPPPGIMFPVALPASDRRRQGKSMFDAGDLARSAAAGAGSPTAADRNDTAMADFKLHCFAQSGNAYKVAMMLDLCGADWEPVFVDYFGGATRGSEFREGISELGEVPVLEHDGQRLSQSGVILDYLAGQLGRFGAETEAERREIWRWILFDNHKFTSYFATHRWLRHLAEPKGHPEVIAFLAARARGALATAEKRLSARPFIVGDRPTIADISMAGYMFYPVEETGFDLDREFPAVAAWADRLSELPGWRAPYEAMPNGLVPA